MRGQDGHQRGAWAADDHAPEPPPLAIGTDERRMHVRAYNYWVSLLAGRAFPSIADLDPASLGDFGPNSVLLDFRTNAADPGIAWLGRVLRDEGGLGDDIRTIADVPGRSLLSRLTDHCLQIIANRAPIGFEAEFVNVRGNNALYRGILMPFSSDGTTIDYIYGVLNWKELADAGLTAEIVAAADRTLAAMRAQTAAPPAAVWADGPSRSLSGRARDVPAGFPADPVDLAALDRDDPAADLADRLATARASAEDAASSDQRSRATLYRAVAHAYAFACAAETLPDAYAELLDDAGLTRQARAPMTPIAKLVFGAGCDKTRLAEYAAVLAHGRRLDLAPAEFAGLLDRQAGGLKALVAAERAAKRPARAVQADPRVHLRAATPTATVALAVADEFVLLVGRRTAPGEVAILATIAGDSPMIERALRRAARG